MTKQEFEKTGKWDIVEDKKTGEKCEVKEKKDRYFVFSDKTTGEYKDYKVCKEHTESFDSIYSYDYLRNRWVFDCKAYSENGKWYWLWNHEYVRDISNYEMKMIEKFRKENKEKNMLSVCGNV